MTPRERLKTVLNGHIPDCVPASPDFSNMIPARLTGKPFWDLYLYNDPPIWEAFIDCAKKFDIDALMDGYFPLKFPDERANEEEWEKYIIHEDSLKIVTQCSRLENGRRKWQSTVDVYHVADPPNYNISPPMVGLPQVPARWKPVEGIKPVDTGPAGLSRVKQLLGDQGLVGVFATSTVVLEKENDIYDYYDNPSKYQELAEARIEKAEKRFKNIMEMETLPDFICVGGSGTLIFQTMEIFRELALPAVKRIIDLSTKAGIPTHVHSCGPEKDLIKLFAEETNLTVIDPLEASPMGDCDLASLKKLYGDKIVLKGNLHTTDLMLNGTVKDVVAASKKAIDDAAQGGRFILSTGDQCGRDTPDENIFAMVETARTYGKYK